LSESQWIEDTEEGGEMLWEVRRRKKEEGKRKKEKGKRKKKAREATS
jgi:hypothetical protein